MIYKLTIYQKREAANQKTSTVYVCDVIFNDNDQNWGWGETVIDLSELCGAGANQRQTRYA